MDKVTTIQISQGFEAIIDVEDYERVNKYKWYRHKRPKTNYVSRAIGDTKKDTRKIITLHRFILNITDSNIHIDHINGNGLDNRKENLRLCNMKQNLANATWNFKNKTSKYTGVYKKKEKFVAEYGRKYIGTFTTEEEAAEAYNKVKLEKTGEFAKLNLL